MQMGPPGQGDVAEHKTPPQETVPMANIKEFCASILKKLAPPLLREVEASKLCVDAEPFTPRRFMRRSASAAIPAGRNACKATAADTVLLRALGITSPDMAVNYEHG